MKKLVSIVIPTRNRRDLLAQAIESCLRQSHEALEMIVVDDASVDDTRAWVEGLGDRRVVYVRQRQASGSVAALNRGFALARGEYLTWSSDDDFYLPQAIAAMAAVLDVQAEVDFVYARYWMVDKDGNILYPARVEPARRLDEDNYVGHCFLYRRKVYETIGAYHAAPFLAEEYEYWLRVRERFVMKCLEVPLYCHRVHPAALTSMHGVDRMQAAVAMARRPFISAWQHYFLVARWHYHAGRRLKSGWNAFLSIVLRPWHMPSWRLLVLAGLPSRLLALVRLWRNGPCAG